MTVDFARQQGLNVIMRGLRAVSDFEFEFPARDDEPSPDTASRDPVFLTPTEQFNSSPRR